MGIIIQEAGWEHELDRSASGQGEEEDSFE